MERARCVERLPVLDASAKDTVEGGSPFCSTRACARNLGTVSFNHQMIDKHVPIDLQAY